jgi:flagellar biogenesis protein FliO
MTGKIVHSYEETEYKAFSKLELTMIFLLLNFIADFIVFVCYTFRPVGEQPKSPWKAYSGQKASFFKNVKKLNYNHKFISRHGPK